MDGTMKNTNGTLPLMVWTLRKNKVRIISLRKANSREVKRYEQSENQDAR